MTRKKEAGQALIVGALALVGLLGFAGLGIDEGVLRYERRVQQSAADAAAIAGANNLAFASGVTAGAQNAAAGNGFTDNGGGNVANCGAGAAVGTICVEVNNGPASGPNAGNTNYVEVLVAEVRPTYFMRILGSSFSQESVQARAVATETSGGGPGSGCVYTLGPPTSTIQGVNINGHATINATTCGIEGNGNFDPTGGALTVNAGTFSVAGTCSGSGCGKGTVTCADQAGPCPATGAPSAANPLAALTPPAVGTAQAYVPGDGPGTYNGISLSGNGTVNFPSGIYVVTGGSFVCHGTPGITGTGVMFYFTNGATFSCSGNDAINLTAPSPTNCPACPSEYDGILMYQDPADTTAGPSVGGNTGSTYNGALYFPTVQVTFFGNNSSVAVGLVVADAIAVSGNPTVDLEGTVGLKNLGLTVNTIKTAILVE